MRFKGKSAVFFIGLLVASLCAILPYSSASSNLSINFTTTQSRILFETANYRGGNIVQAFQHIPSLGELNAYLTFDEFPISWYVSYINASEFVGVGAYGSGSGVMNRSNDTLGPAAYPNRTMLYDTGQKFSSLNPTTSYMYDYIKFADTWTFTSGSKLQLHFIYTYEFNSIPSYVYLVKNGVIINTTRFTYTNTNYDVDYNISFQGDTQFDGIIFTTLSTTSTQYNAHNLDSIVSHGNVFSSSDAQSNLLPNGNIYYDSTNIPINCFTHNATFSFSINATDPENDQIFHALNFDNTFFNDFSLSQDFEDANKNADLSFYTDGHYISSGSDPVTNAVISPWLTNEQCLINLKLNAFTCNSTAIGQVGLDKALIIPQGFPAWSYQPNVPLLGKASNRFRLGFPMNATNLTITHADAMNNQLMKTDIKYLENETVYVYIDDVLKGNFSLTKFNSGVGNYMYFDYNFDTNSSTAKFDLETFEDDIHFEKSLTYTDLSRVTFETSYRTKTASEKMWPVWVLDNILLDGTGNNIRGIEWTTSVPNNITFSDVGHYDINFYLTDLVHKASMFSIYKLPVNVYLDPSLCWEQVQNATGNNTIVPMPLPEFIPPSTDPFGNYQDYDVYNLPIIGPLRLFFLGWFNLNPRISNIFHSIEWLVFGILFIGGLIKGMPFILALLFSSLIGVLGGIIAIFSIPFLIAMALIFSIGIAVMIFKQIYPGNTNES